MGILEEIGNYEYHCPHCSENLRAKDGIEFLTLNKDGEMFPIFLDPNLGKYDFYYDYSHVFNEGDKVNFSCPRCEESLISKKHSDYVEIDMIVSNDVKFEVLFSRMYGVKKTYLVLEDCAIKYTSDGELDLSDLHEI